MLCRAASDDASTTSDSRESSEESSSNAHAQLLDSLLILSTKSESESDVAAAVRQDSERATSMAFLTYCDKQHDMTNDSTRRRHISSVIQTCILERENAAVGDDLDASAAFDAILPDTALTSAQQTSLALRTDHLLEQMGQTKKSAIATILGRVDGERAAQPGMSERIAAYVVDSVPQELWKDTLASAFEPPNEETVDDSNSEEQQVWTTPLALVRCLDDELRRRQNEDISQEAWDENQLATMSEPNLRALRDVAIDFVDERLRSSL